MVRHYVDNRRPNLDRRRRHRDRLVPVRAPVRPGHRGRRLARRVVDAARPAGRRVARPRRSSPARTVRLGRTDLLDRLTLADGAAGTDVADAALHALRAEAGTSALVVVTGDVPTDRFLRHGSPSPAARRG